MTGKNLFRLVAASVGVLFTVQVALNIFLYLTFYRNLEAQYKDVTEDREELKRNLYNIGEVIANYTQNGWQYFNGSLYYVSSTQKTWDESRADCLQRGADLIIINSREEQDFTRRQKDHMWIGLTDVEKEGTWKWVDGTPLTTSYWSINEPNSYNSKDEDCVEVMYHEIRNSWNDEACQINYIWICEKKLLL